MQTELRPHSPVVGEEEQRQVRVALNPRVMAAYLAEIFDYRPDGVGPVHATCYILDVKYEPGDYCTVLYRLGERLVIGKLRWGSQDVDGEIPKTARLVDELGMQVFSFEQDPALPGLKTALAPDAMVEVLGQALPESYLGSRRVLRCRVTPLRYRPGKRCTLRVDIWLRDPRGQIESLTLFGKVYHKLDKAASVYREMGMLSNSTPAVQGRVAFAPAVAFLPDIALVLQGPVEGVPLEVYLDGLGKRVTAGDPRGWEGVVRSAPALAAVHTAGLATDRERPIGKELERFVKRATQAAQVDPKVGEPLLRLAEKLPEWVEMLPEWGAGIALIHGDCKPSQFLIAPDRVGILDFDHCGMSDPASDVGTYLATLRQLAIWQALVARDSTASRSRAVWLRALEHRFLAEYTSSRSEAAGSAGSSRDDGFRLLATWYEAVGLMRKALRAFARSPRSPMPLAQAEEAWRCLAELPVPAGRNGRRPQ